MTDPDIFIKLPGGLYGSIYAKAHIRERIKGQCIYRYLVWRGNAPDAAPKEFYLGKLALQKKGSSAPAGRGKNRRSTESGRRAPAGAARRGELCVG